MTMMTVASHLSLGRLMLVLPKPGATSSKPTYITSIRTRSPQ